MTVLGDTFVFSCFPNAEDPFFLEDLRKSNEGGGLKCQLNCSGLVDVIVV
jgi:hypothetical protein